MESAAGNLAMHRVHQLAQSSIKGGRWGATSPLPLLRPRHPYQVGMGTSKLQEGMVQHGGFKRVVNVDVSSVGALGRRRRGARSSLPVGSPARGWGRC